MIFYREKGSHSRNFTVLLVGGYFLLVLMGCGGVEREEIERIKSPDSAVDAVIVRTNAGATAAFGYNLYLVPTGGRPIEGHEVFIADNLAGLDITWRNSKLLDIKYRRARIFHFTNFWSSKELEDFRYLVEIRLLPLEGETQ